MSTMPNPLQGQPTQNPLGWPGMTGTNMPAPSVAGSPTIGGAPAPAPSAGGATTPSPASTNPFSGVTTPSPSPTGGGKLASNLAQQNYETGVLRNQLLPIFAQLFGGATGDAQAFFEKLLNLGSPYYKQQQEASFNAGVNNAQNTQATARQQINASGYGAAPSGLEAAEAGGAAVGESANLSQLYLQNLFQNENMQALGAQGLASLAQLFNPANLTGQGTGTGIQQGQNTASQIMSSIGQLSSGIFGNSGIPT